MSDRIFIDTNVLLYTVSNVEDKKRKAVALLKQHAVISSQVISESINVMSRKLGFSYPDIRPIIDKLAERVEIYPVQLGTAQTALYIAERYRFSYYDSQIIASALEHQCDVLYSEDMQDGQVIEQSLKIVDPFK